MSEEIDASDPALQALTIDPDGSPVFTAMFGKKGFGKSFLARRYFDGWPYDRVVIDPNNDLEIPGAITYRGKAPEAWPDEVEGFVTIRFVPDLRMPKRELDAELDRMLMLAFYNRGHPPAGEGSGLPCMLWVDEIVKVAKSNSTLPAMDLILHQGRHQGLFCLFCGPRPMVIDPLVISQSDLVFLFRLKGVADRKRISETTGLSPAEVEGLMTLPERYFDVYVDRLDLLIECPPIPA